ncbi:SMI1/KNR4 family protein [Bacillus paranthracis]|uniref:SMI1/KNR4 family protein n=1 Tax=Bacillus paranthracis TaxID=2026186 RepID=UPI00132F2F10|nr:SMI1/KNR4 family protein [Bacillus paranthracis]MCD1180252.1 SMI1/KNR4 family protein [Bacillus paranthracis]QHH84988.1 SMI1/KNR4 family protein [Bacillus paranthracis]HDR4567446.1 SMI1/KNR4 family protein [Bacillus paranthracis]
MNILEKLNDSFTLEAQESPASKEAIQELQKFSSIDVPLDYLEVIQNCTNAEINVQNELYIRIWGPTDCIEMNKAHDIQKYIPNSLAIGDDEGGKALLYGEGKEGFGLYTVDFGDLDIEEAIKIAPSLKALLIDGVGVEELLS